MSDPVDGCAAIGATDRTDELCARWPLRGRLVAPTDLVSVKLRREKVRRCPKKPAAMIRKLKSGEYRLYSRKTDARTGKRKNLGTFPSRAAAEKHERAVQYFKRHG
jgi:hypothetical protein